MERTLEGLRQPHRYVLDDAQLHIYMLMKKVGPASLSDPAKAHQPSSVFYLLGFRQKYFRGVSATFLCSLCHSLS